MGSGEDRLVSSEDSIAGLVDFGEFPIPPREQIVENTAQDTQCVFVCQNSLPFSGLPFGEAEADSNANCAAYSCLVNPHHHSLAFDSRELLAFVGIGFQVCHLDAGQHVTARVEQASALSIGDRATFTAAPETLHLFGRSGDGDDDAGEVLT